MTKPNTRFQKLTRDGHSWTYADKVYTLHRDNDGQALGRVWYEKVKGCAPEWCYHLLDSEGREGETVGYPDWKAETAASSLLSEVGLRPTNHIPDGDSYCPCCGFWPNDQYVEEEGSICIFCPDKPALVIKGSEPEPTVDSEPEQADTDSDTYTDDELRLLCRMVEASVVTERVPAYEPATREQRLALLKAVHDGKLPADCVGFCTTPDGVEFLASSSAASVLKAVEEWGAPDDSDSKPEPTIPEDTGTPAMESLDWVKGSERGQWTAEDGKGGYYSTGSGGRAVCAHFDAAGNMRTVCSDIDNLPEAKYHAWTDHNGGRSTGGVKCYECGTLRTPEYKGRRCPSFSNNCSGRFEDCEADTAENEQAAPPAAPPASIDAPADTICGGCGWPSPSRNAMLCWNCGQRLDS